MVVGAVSRTFVEKVMLSTEGQLDLSEQKQHEQQAQANRVRIRCCYLKFSIQAKFGWVCMSRLQATHVELPSELYPSSGSDRREISIIADQ
jgi:hypothetical protein